MDCQDDTTTFLYHLHYETDNNNAFPCTCGYEKLARRNINVSIYVIALFLHIPIILVVE